LGAALLCGCVERCVTLRLCLGSLDDQLGEIGVIASDQPFFLADLSGQGRDERLFLELIGNPLGDRRDRFGFALPGQLKALSAVIAQLGKIDGTLALIVRMGLEDDPLDFADEPFGSTFGRAEILDKLLREITRARGRQRLLASRPSRRRVVSEPPPQVSLTWPLPRSARAH